MKFLISYILLSLIFINNLLAQNTTNSYNIENDSSKINNSDEINILVKSGKLNWSKKITNRIDSNIKFTLKRNENLERDSLLLNGVLKWSELRKKQDNIELKRLLDNKVIRWSEKKNNLDDSAKIDN